MLLMLLVLLLALVEELLAGLRHTVGMACTRAYYRSTQLSNGMYIHMF